MELLNGDDEITAIPSERKKRQSIKEVTNMNYQPHRWNMRIQEQRRIEHHREMAKIENAYYDGEVVNSEYSKAISDLLKDPVSLAIAGANSDRGYPR